MLIIILPESFIMIVEVLRFFFKCIDMKLKKTQIMLNRRTEICKGNGCITLQRVHAGRA